MSLAIPGGWGFDAVALKIVLALPQNSIKANPNFAEMQQNIRFCVDHVSIKVPLPRLKMLKSKYERNSHNFAFQCFQHLPTSSHIFQLSNTIT